MSNAGKKVLAVKSLAMSGKYLIFALVESYKHRGCRPVVMDKKKMSRIGKQPVLVPSGVECKVNGSTVDVKGRKGEVSRQLHPNLRIE